MVDCIDNGNYCYFLFLFVRDGKFNQNSHHIIVCDRTILCPNELSSYLQQAHPKILATVKNNARFKYSWDSFFSWI